MVITYLAFQEAAKLFSIASAPFYIPTNHVQEFQFIHISASTRYFLIFKIIYYNNGHCSGCQVVSHCGFEFHFPND